MSEVSSDSARIDDLFAAALQADDEAAWDAIANLQHIGSKVVLDQTLKLTRSNQALERERGASIIGQLGIPERTFPDACFTALAHLLADGATSVISAAIHALGHLERERAASLIIEFVGHPDAEVRFAVASSLGGVETTEAVEALLTLMTDSNPDTRDWATFGLGELSEADSDQIRSALAARLDDDNPDVRYEAAIGLGKRRDLRSKSRLKSILLEEPENFFGRVAAARLLGLVEDTDVTTAELVGALDRL